MKKNNNKPKLPINNLNLDLSINKKEILQNINLSGDELYLQYDTLKDRIIEHDLKTNSNEEIKSTKLTPFVTILAMSRPHYKKNDQNSPRIVATSFKINNFVYSTSIQANLYGAKLKFIFNSKTTYSNMLYSPIQ